jgi:meso-butanediol dehydrogenase/(S,S)-butanediol dehydrogenase/diacetyl reductase
MDLHGRGEKWRQMEARAPIGRAGTDEEVAGLITFLCTEAASWITGQSINIDGGLVMEH